MAMAEEKSRFPPAVTFILLLISTSNFWLPVRLPRRSRVFTNEQKSCKTLLIQCVPAECSTQLRMQVGATNATDRFSKNTTTPIMNYQTHAVSSKLEAAKRRSKIGLTACAIAVLVAGNVSAEEYQSGAGALEVFDASARAAVPLPLKIWLMLLLGTFAASIIFAWKKPVARWALGGLVVAMLAGGPVLAALGWPMLGGGIALSHLVCWTPVLIVLLWKRPFLDTQEWLPYRIWSALLLAVIIISFVFDIRDAWIYVNHVSSLKV